jgi:hypothetical protein
MQSMSYIFIRLYGGQVGLSLSIFSGMLLSLISFLLFFSIITNSNAQLNDFSQITFKNSEHKEMEAYGRIAANQIKNGSISWIQAGLWYMTIAFNDLDNNKDAYFYTDFAMVKPDGSSMHKHFIRDFNSTDVDIQEEKITIKGIADIYSGKSLDYEDVPIIVDLKDNTVLGLIIDKEKTEQHFASSTANEMFGVLIDSRGLEQLISEKNIFLAPIQNYRLIQI